MRPLPNVHFITDGSVAWTRGKVNIRTVPLYSARRILRFRKIEHGEIVLALKFTVEHSIHNMALYKSRRTAHAAIRQRRVQPRGIKGAVGKIEPSQ